jgi:hypothetical protein
MYKKWPLPDMGRGTKNIPPAKAKLLKVVILPIRNK